MDISTTASMSSADIQIEIQKKAQEVQAEQINKVVENGNEQVKKEDISKKTGIGSQLDIAG